jgi:hypothetical protein
MVTNRAASPAERLTWDEICRRHPEQWVVLADITRVSRTDFAFTGAEVIATFTERKAATPTMKELHAANRRSVGCFFTGNLIKGDVDPLWHSRP